MIPLFLNPAGRLCVVIGGGEVGRRKAHALLDAGARVRLVCLEQQPGDFRSEALSWITTSYRTEHLDGAALVFAAATADLNRQVVADAHARGLLVNASTDPESGDFFLPAVLRRGDITIAVATRGLAPAMARGIRDWLAEAVDDSFARWLDLVAELRPEINLRTADAHCRAAIFQHLCDEGWPERLRLEPVEEVRQAMRADVERLLAAHAMPGDRSPVRE
jgi:precorrin-2 dehydrogenase/sirohydrochlorin ferrochelatase